MKADERHACTCRCDCPNSATIAAPLCWLCTQGTHRLPRDIRIQLERRLGLAGREATR